MKNLRVACAQLNPIVGDFAHNRNLIAEAMDWAEEIGADLLLTPELGVPGYPPEDLVHRKAFVERNREVVEELAAHARETVTIVGFVDVTSGSGPARGAADAVDRGLANAAALVVRGSVAAVYHKVLLPNYGVFDEDRYFLPGGRPGELFDVAGVAVGVSVCEDIWRWDGPPADQAAAGAQLLVNINASPYHRGKVDERVGLARNHAISGSVPVVYLNQVGGQDELVFDGHSMVFGPDGKILFQAPMFETARFAIDIAVPEPSTSRSVTSVRPEKRPDRPELDPPEQAERLGPEAEVYKALQTGLTDYVAKNGFSQVVIGLSGGVDSALTAAIAADAIGPDRVWGVAMPSRFSSEASVSDAKELAARLGIRFDIVPIDDIFQAYLDGLSELFEGTEPGVAEENLQARIRGAVLMALSNKHGALVVATGNKSETAVGYATLYGDMVGGFSVLKDVFKTLAYRLAEWRNRAEEVIPKAIIDKPPSAELRPDQVDTDSLPPYEVLDQILGRYVEEDMSVSAIVGDGFDRGLVEEVAAMVDGNEYKRRQAAPGVKITTKAFGKDRRLPITNRYRSK